MSYSLTLSKRWMSALFVFVRECLRAPRSIGSLCPSGLSLSRTIARKAAQCGGVVVELGAGTGAITHELIRNGISPGHLVIIDNAPSMVQVLRQRFPGATVVEADAAHFSEHLPPAGKVSCIVSSLPFLTLPAVQRDEIIDEIKRSLHGGLLLQYTYCWARQSCLERAGFVCVSSVTVWQNMPPARVSAYRLP